jgi:hypothetical protein
VVSGHAQVINHLKTHAVILLPEDAGSEIKIKMSKRNNPGLTLVIPISKAQVGEILNASPRSVLGLAPGCSTQSLIDSLQGWCSLG